MYFQDSLIIRASYFLGYFICIDYVLVFLRPTEWSSVERNSMHKLLNLEDFLLLQ